ncbi:hypothetical protein [Mahella australiensis]|uniref:Uroporphyrinogen decarboxylase (URO-D) domain-containing protein n=1 Tax=Mahella australiensis (strain DSM 15567 / CIP 107919 / 50-1 BON) TaxID=697281 RepID=F3ZWH0_MAHA5|nr:hypothetical protein [Mahella australiensis]AEE95405.1 hypothetical protein Mahau_0182 [Mahella australiensis 50-1 BON]
MKQRAEEILNDDKLLLSRKRWFDRLESLFDGECIDKVIYLNGIYGRSNIDPYKEPERWLTDALDDLASRADKLLDNEVFRPLCIEFGPYGVHFIDKILGANVYFDEISNQWYNEYIQGHIGQLCYPDLEQNEAWNLAKRLARAFIESKVKVPLFGLPTIASVLNVAVNLYGQRFLEALYITPNEAEHDIKVINRLLCDLHGWYLKNIPIDQLQPVISGHRTQPPGFGQLCGCSTQLISSRMYREFIAPFDDQLLSTYPHGGMIHLCGNHVQHIPVWREMKSLRAIQVNDRAAEDLETYFVGLREDQIIYLNPTDMMTVEKAIKITKGKRLVIVADI